MSLVDIIIPTWNNPDYLIQCVQSLFLYTIPEDMFTLYIVNNGDPGIEKYFVQNPRLKVLQQEKNLGWEGGLKAGLAASSAPYVVFMNDDAMIPSHQRLWLHKILNHFAFDQCSAVGPTSNVVMGKQNIFLQLKTDLIRTKFLIGFCMAVRRADLEAAGGIDDTLPGGDDLDLSIRLRDLGKYLLIDRDVFVYHHGFKTGERVEGKATEENGWNSIQKIERTNHALIRKHGLNKFLDLWQEEPEHNSGNMMREGWGDPESELVKKYAIGDKIVELGCGTKKIFPNSIGLDIVPNGDPIPGLISTAFSVADMVTNVEKDLPVDNCDTITAQHILEHCVDAVSTVRSWKKSLRSGGRLIIAVPDHTHRNTIVMNHQHCHGWTPDSLKNFMETLGLHTIAIEDSKNDVSFVGVFEKNGL